MFGTYSLLLVGLGGLCFATALQQSVLALRLRDRREAFYAFGIFCGGVVSLLSIAYYHARDVDEFRRAYQWHAVVTRPLFFAYALLILDYARFEKPWVPVLYLGAEGLKAVLLLANLNTPYFLRIDGLAYVWSWGEALATPQGVGTRLQAIQMIMPFIALGVSLEAARRVWKRGERKEGLLVAFAGSAGILAVLVDNFFDLWLGQDLHLVELALLGPCLLVSWRASHRLVGAAETSAALADREARLAVLMESRAEAQRLAALGTLAGGIAHDFNNILMAISTQLELLEGAQPAEREAALRSARAATQRGRDVIRRILAFAKQGRAPEPRPVDLEAALAEAKQFLRSLLPAHVELEGGLGLDAGLHALCDPVQLQQVLVNLGLNAGQALGERPGFVRIEARSLLLDEGRGLSPGLYAQILVTDNGPGMDEAVRHRVFEPFFSTKGQGNGLGLPVVHGIVSSFGGSVHCESAPGKGARFTVLLPGSLGPPAPAPADDAKSPAAPAPLGEVLVLDDEDDIADALRRLLQRRGLRAHAVSQPQEALDLIASQPGRFQVLITDLSMPGMNGREVQRRARGLDPGLRVILSSGSQSLGADAEGFDAVLEKPFNSAELEAALRKGPRTPS